MVQDALRHPIYLTSNKPMEYYYWLIPMTVVHVMVLNYVYHAPTPTSPIRFKYDRMPLMRPIRITTNTKSFWSTALVGETRKWEIIDDFQFKLRNNKYVIPSGFVFDAVSVPTPLSLFVSPIGVLLLGGLVHDYIYKYEVLLKEDKKSVSSKITRKEADEIFRDINLDHNGMTTLNYIAYYAVRLGGFIPWNEHRRNNADPLKLTQ